MRQYDVPLNELPENLAAALAYWRGLGGERLQCGWRDFELYSIPAAVLPSTLVIDVFEDSDRNRYRFWGSRMTVLHGRDMTGMSPYDIHPADMAPELRRQHDLTRRDACASASRYGFVRDSGVEHVHYVLRLPLSDNGKTIAQIVVVTDMGDDDRDYMQNQFALDE